MNGYKILDKDFKSDDVQFTVGKTTHHDNPDDMGFCATAINCLKYSCIVPSNKYVEVHADNWTQLDGDYITTALTIVNEISYDEFRGMCTGTIRWWHPNGKIYAESEYVNGTRHGIHKLWYENGDPEYESTYDNGRICDQYKE